MPIWSLPESARVTSPVSSPGNRSRSSLAYRVLVSPAVRERLAYAPPPIRGYVTGAVAFLRTDPHTPDTTSSFQLLQGDGYRVLLLPGRRLSLAFEVVEERHAVVLLDVAWSTR